jgi:hypothetical protein
MAAKNTITTVGDFTAILAHPLILGGVGLPLKGFKLEDMFIVGAQMVANTKRVLLANGDTLALTNAVTAGTLTIQALHISNNILDGDLPLLATQLQGLADNIGGLLTISRGFNGDRSFIVFTDVRLVSCPPITIAVNDSPSYTVVFSYGTYTRF